jgi:hypothetical protein
MCLGTRRDRIWGEEASRWATVHYSYFSFLEVRMGQRMCEVITSTLYFLCYTFLNILLLCTGGWRNPAVPYPCQRMISHFALGLRKLLMVVTHLQQRPPFTLSYANYMPKPRLLSERISVIIWYLHMSPPTLLF